MSNPPPPPASTLTFPDVVAVLEGDGLPTVRPELLRALIAIEGRPFGAAVVAIRDRATGWSEKRIFLRERLLCLCNYTLDAIQSVGFKLPSAEVLADIARHECPAFHHSAAKLLGDDNITAHKHIASIFLSYGMPATDIPMTPCVPTTPVADSSSLPLGGTVSVSVNHRTDIEEAPLEVGDDDPDIASDGTSLIECVRFYGKKSAICITATVTRSGSIPTVQLEGTAAIGPQKYDWSRKVSIQLADRELPALLSVLMGPAPDLKGSGRGDNRNKYFEIKKQDGGFYFSVGHGSLVCGVPVASTSVFKLISLLLKQMQKGNPHLTIDSILQILNALFAAEQH